MVINTEELYNKILVQRGFMKTTDPIALYEWGKGASKVLATEDCFKIKEIWVAPTTDIAFGLGNLVSETDKVLDGEQIMVIGIKDKDNYIITPLPGFACLSIFAAFTLALDPKTLLEEED